MRAIAFGFLGIALLAGLFWLFKPQANPSRQTPPAPATAADLAPLMTISQGQLASGPEFLRALQGEQVRVRLLSDADAELHLHGYDLHVHLRSGVPGELVFTAEHSGRFELELHGNGGGHAALAVIEVAPPR